MDLRQLEMFLAVAESNGFTRAAETLHVAQSAISRKISLLESELGEILFKRVSKGIRLTPAGEILLRYARRVFRELKDASMEISDVAHLKRGKIRIGAGMIACMYTVPPVLARFRALYPAIEFEVVTGTTENLLGDLRDNSIDLGIFVLPIDSSDVDVRPLSVEELVVVTSAQHPTLSRKRSLRAAELAHHPLILFARTTYTRRVIDRFFARAGITPRIAMEAGNVATIRPLVRANLGVTIIPLPAVLEEAARGELHYLRISDHKLTRQLGLVLQRSEYLPRILSELARLFTDHASAANAGRKIGSI